MQNYATPLSYKVNFLVSGERHIASKDRFTVISFQGTGENSTTQITGYLTDKKILNPHQTGFRENDSTQAALLKLTEDIRAGIDERSEEKLITILSIFRKRNPKQACAADILSCYIFLSYPPTMNSLIIAKSSPTIYSDELHQPCLLLFSVP